MKMKILALSILLVTASVQAEYIRVPALKVLRERLKDDVIALGLLEGSGFLKGVAGREVEPFLFAGRLRFAAFLILIEKYYRYHAALGVSTGLLTESDVVNLRLKMRDFNGVVKEANIAGAFKDLTYGGNWSQWSKQYDLEVHWLYRNFFMDCQRVLMFEENNFEAGHSLCLLGE